MNPTVERVFRLRDCDIAKERLRLPRMTLVVSVFFLATAFGIHLWFLYFMKPMSQEAYALTPRLLERVKGSKSASEILTHMESSEIAIRTYLDGFHVIAVCSFVGLAVFLLLLSLSHRKLFELVSQVNHEQLRFAPERSSTEVSLDSKA